MHAQISCYAAPPSPIMMYTKPCTSRLQALAVAEAELAEAELAETNAGVGPSLRVQTMCWRVGPPRRR
jgi:hypothetical protein